MQDPNYQSAYRDQTSSLSPVQRLLSRITLKIVLCYSAAMLFSLGFFIIVLPDASTTRDRFVEIAVFFASIILQALLSLLTLHNRHMREPQVQMVKESAVSRRHLTLTYAFMGVLCLALAVAVIVGNVYSSNSLVVGVARSYAIGSLIAL